jgi:hypothetical protein
LLISLASFLYYPLHDAGSTAPPVCDIKTNQHSFSLGEGEGTWRPTGELRGDAESK